MTADHMPAPNTPRKQPAVTATMHTNYIQAAEHRRDQATRRLATLSNYVFGEGFLPDVAAAAAGYKNRAAAYRSARHAGRPELAAALRLPTTTERRAAQIEDLEFLLSVGEYPERAVVRCGFQSVVSARKLLHKWGRPDLAAQLLAAMRQLDTEGEDAA